MYKSYGNRDGVGNRAGYGLQSPSGLVAELLGYPNSKASACLVFSITRGPLGDTSNLIVISSS